MKTWNRINKTDRKKDKSGKDRIIVRGFMGFGLGLLGMPKVNKRVKFIMMNECDGYK